MNKYGNRKTAVSGIVFDSQKEAVRYQELMLLAKAGSIENLKLQPEFTLQEAFKTPDGESIRALKYRADFSYEKLVREGPDTIRVKIVEDVKGFKTKEYNIKDKLMRGFGVRVVEI